MSVYRWKRVGADISFVMTAQEAALPIKCYGPELMVLPIYSISKFQEKTNDEEEIEHLIGQSMEKVNTLSTNMIHIIMYVFRFFFFTSI